MTYSTGTNVQLQAPIEDFYDIIKHFLKEIGIRGVASYGAVLKKEHFVARRYEESNYLFSRIDGPTSVKKPAGLHAIYYYQGNYDDIVLAYNHFLNLLNQEHLQIDGDLYEEYLLHSLVSKNEAEFVTKFTVKVKT